MINVVLKKRLGFYDHFLKFAFFKRYLSISIMTKDFFTIYLHLHYSLRFDNSPVIINVIIKIVYIPSS